MLIKGGIYLKKQKISLLTTTKIYLIFLTNNSYNLLKMWQKRSISPNGLTHFSSFVPKTLSITHLGGVYLYN